MFVSTTRAGGSGLSQRQLAARLIARGHRVVILTDAEHGHRMVRYLYKRQVNLSTKLRGSPIRPALLRLQRPFGQRVARAGEYEVPVYFSPVPENGYRTLMRWFAPDVVVASSIERVTWRRLRAQLRVDGIPSVLYLREQVAQGHLTISHAMPDLLLANSHSLAEQARRAGLDCLMIPSVIETDATRTTSTRQRVLLINPHPSYGGDRLWGVAHARPDIAFAAQESSHLPSEARAEVLAQIAQLPNVELRARTSDLRSIYRDARILFVPHRMDNRPRVVAEAQANGIPVVAAAYPGLVEAVGPGGVLVDPYAPDLAWVDAVSSLWDDPDRYHELVDAARNHSARPEVDPDAVTARFEEAVMTMVAGRGRTMPRKADGH